ncbi:Lipopolysaccharide export system ATP-binding protein LptB [bacterium HR12]|nr:Lipopolysaccharide export system ATP-binding protein LptB [bacterium HR12]
MSVLEVSDLAKRFGSLEALRGVSFAVEEGEVFGIAGPNGAGKSVLFACIAGFYRPSSGSIRLDGEEIVGLGPHQICHRGLVRTFQTPALFHSLSIRENVLIGARFGGAKEDRVEDILRFLDLERVAERRAVNLDLFTTKRVVLAAALATGCRVLLLDEPMAGFSFGEVERYLDLVAEIRRTCGVTILIIEHLLDVLIGVSDRMMILHHGQVLFSGPPDEVRRHQGVVDVYLGGGTGG